MSYQEQENPKTIYDEKAVEDRAEILKSQVVKSCSKDMIRIIFNKMIFLLPM